MPATKPSTAKSGSKKPATKKPERVVLFGPDTSRLGRARIQQIVEEWFALKAAKAAKAKERAKKAKVLARAKTKKAAAKF